MTEPDLRLDELKELAEREDLHPFLQRALNVHPSDLADVLSALDEPTRVRVIAELPTETASSALAEMEAAEHPEELLLAVGPEYAADLPAVEREVKVVEHAMAVVAVAHAVDLEQPGHGRVIIASNKKHSRLDTGYETSLLQ